MPNIRIGFGTDFNLKNEQIGIGLTNQSVRLQVAGNIRAERLITTGSGINTFYAYDGFLNDKQESNYDLSIDISDKGNLNSLSGEIVINGEVTVSEDTPLTGGRLDSLTVTGKFDLPQGGSEDREDTPEKGSTRFNQDLGQLEFYTGYEWRTVNSYADSGGRGRGVFGGGLNTPFSTSNIEYININSKGNSKNFGDLTVSRRWISSLSSSTRGVFTNGQVSPAPGNNTIDYITIASEGNAIDFGDGVSAYGSSACSSSTRGIIAAGFVAGATITNAISYITISTLGDSNDFGDLLYLLRYSSSSSSPTRGIFAGGSAPGNIPIENIQYVTLSSLGNAINFGSLTHKRSALTSFSNSVRSLFCGGGIDQTANWNTIDHITISSLGNAIDFGDLTVGRLGSGSASSNATGVILGGTANEISGVNIIDYVTISTSGNALDFGDAIQTIFTNSGCSDSHGGLGGF